jgi:hypothetical protein
MRVIDDGPLRGYVPVDKNWTGYTVEDYQTASESAYTDRSCESMDEAEEIAAKLNLSGYQIVRAQFFSTSYAPALTISNGSLRFNTACLKKFEDVEYVELLLNSVDRCIAIRPCDANNPNAIHWGSLRENRWTVRASSCKGLAKVLFGMMDWNTEMKYKFRGEFRSQENKKVMLFYLDEPEIIKTTKVELPPETPDEANDSEPAADVPEEKQKYKSVRAILYPVSWLTTFGRSVESLIHSRVLTQKHYAGNWDVLAPGREVEECCWITTAGLNALMSEAERIMDRW